MGLNNLANSLSALGRREDALAAAEEATQIYRDLAAARPDAFRPNLALSLANLANRLFDLGRRQDALAAAKEAVSTLGPFFLAHPAAFSSWMGSIVHVYSRLSDDLDQRADTAILQPVLEAFEKLAGQRRKPRHQLDRSPGTHLHRKTTMIDLAATAVSLLALYLAKAAGKGAEQIGTEVATRLAKLYDTLRTKLTKPSAAEALADLEKAPEDADAQAALRLQLKKVLAEDADLRHALEPLVREIQDQGGAGPAQSATVAGNENDVNQIVGSGNTVAGRGGPR
jgi:tetratricopeptide (TPR) repeat protein